jgi:superfamily II DNA or RNA helicase
MTPPQLGMLAIVRNRRAIISGVEPFDTREDGRLHLVHLEYTDTDGVPEDRIIWERELDARVLPPAALPQIESQPPMDSRTFDAMLRASRWTAFMPWLPLSQNGEKLPAITAPFLGAIQVEDFQLLPLFQTLNMPRISLMIADDVGLGKTVEAGLILTELLFRRRIQRVLILCPASLRHQWAGEMKSKFSLSFDVIDRAETHAMQKRLGLDANPWRTFPRIIASYHYLRQPDVLEQFRSACKQPQGSARLPWDLLIVDEAHNLMPANFGEDSDLARMLRFISPWFEHKIFLTATPHNGHTRCFSGLLAQLDPVRFTQKSEFDDRDRRRVQQVVIRRLKKDINLRDEQHGRIPHFTNRLAPQALDLAFSAPEKALHAAFQAFRTNLKSHLSGNRAETFAAGFAVEILNKRLLSCPYTFADSWIRFKEGLLAEQEADVALVQAARRSVLEEIDDDNELEGRRRFASRTIGAWLKPLQKKLAIEIEQVDSSLLALGLQAHDGAIKYPSNDSRWQQLLQLVHSQLRHKNDWRSDERLIIFTEYKTTLDYLYNRLRALFPEEGVLQQLYGRMDEDEREVVKQAFNDPSHPVPILLATDAASEGINLQETARFILHYDIPWNPSRLEQRNGRLDRHGQARDVQIFHFTSNDDADIAFLAHVLDKINTIREELGSMTEIFNSAIHRRFLDEEENSRVLAELDLAVSTKKGKTNIPSTALNEEETTYADLARLAAEIDLAPQTLRDTLETAMGISNGLPRLEGPDSQLRFRLRHPLPANWQGLIDDSLRLPIGRNALGPIPAIVFDPAFYVKTINDRPVFRPSKDTTLLHLNHPLFRHSLSLFSRMRFGGDGDLAASRWIVRYGPVPKGSEALILLTLEELAMNGLRELFHHWLRTLRLPFHNGNLQPALPAVPAGEDRPGRRQPSNKDVAKAREIWDEAALPIRKLLQEEQKLRTGQAETILAEQGQVALQQEKKRFDERITEVRQALSDLSLKRLEKERDQLIHEMQQLTLFETDARQQAEQLRDLDEELSRRKSQYQDLLGFLQSEKQRTLGSVLPQKFSLSGPVQLFTVCVEIRLPEERS